MWQARHSCIAECHQSISVGALDLDVTLRDVRRSPSPPLGSGQAESAAARTKARAEAEAETTRRKDEAASEVEDEARGAAQTPYFLFD